MKILVKITILFSILTVVACSQESAEQDTPSNNIVRPAKLVNVESLSRSGKRVYPGTVEASSKSDLAFRVGGQLKSLNAYPGKRFKKGEVMAALDESDYRNALDDRKAKYKFAKSQYEKIVELRRENYTSPTNVDQAEANLKEAEAALATAKDNFAHAELIAPFNGIVALVNIENHQVITPNQPILQLRGDENLDVRFSIPESLFGKVRKIESPEGICAQVRFNAYPEKTYEACFKEFESVPDQLTGSYSAVHTMPQIEDFPVLPGMAVSVELDLSFILRNNTSVGVLVPLEAVFEEEDTAWVWKVDEALKVHKTQVVIDKVAGNKLIILEGLSANDTIVAAGTSYLQENMQVRPLSKERGL